MRRQNVSFILCGIVAAGFVSLAPALAEAQGAAPAATANTSKGPAFTDAKGMSLYTRDPDPTGKSTCNGQCAKIWPPFVASADATPSGDWSIVTRDDGTKQWAYKGKPLYDFTKDTKPGDVTGDGFAKNVWHLAHP